MENFDIIKEDFINLCKEVKYISNRRDCNKILYHSRILHVELIYTKLQELLKSIPNNFTFSNLLLDVLYTLDAMNMTYKRLK